MRPRGDIRGPAGGVKLADRAHQGTVISNQGRWDGAALVTLKNDMSVLVFIYYDRVTWTHFTQVEAWNYFKCAREFLKFDRRHWQLLYGKLKYDIEIFPLLASIVKGSSKNGIILFTF